MRLLVPLQFAAFLLMLVLVLVPSHCESTALDDEILPTTTSSSAEGASSNPLLGDQLLRGTAINEGRGAATNNIVDSKEASMRTPSFFPPPSVTPTTTLDTQPLYLTTAAAENDKDDQSQQSHQRKLQGQGCRFVADDGSVTTFEEGQSMGSFAVVSSCANNVPEAFPCYCISSAPQQTVCPYCFYQDTFNQVICGRGDNTVGLLHPNRTFVNCACNVVVSPSGTSYQIDVSSDCDMMDAVSATFANTLTTTTITMAPFFTETAQPATAWPFPATAAPVATAAPTASPISPTTTTFATNPPSTVPPLTEVQPSDNEVPAVAITYQPGNLTTNQLGLWLSHGLSVRTLAWSGQPVQYTATSPFGGYQSDDDFHERPDGAGMFPDNRASNPGGYIWVSNSEVKDGSVGALTFNKDGEVIHYQRVLQGTLFNCNGGVTPWGTWISAEEDFSKRAGRAWQVDPLGIREAKPITLGSEGGSWEAFAYDIRDLSYPRFFLTEDDEEGALRRWTPTNVFYGVDPFELLHGPGLTEFLFLEPDFTTPGVNGQKGTFQWITDESLARQNAKEFYRFTEGIEVLPPFLYFVIKNDFRLFILNLDDMTFSHVSTQAGLFEGEPDQIKVILQEDGTRLVYFSEDWGQTAGIHARDEEGRFFTVLEGPDYQPETTGIQFSPDGKHLYFTFQDDGILFDVTRDDKQSFHAKTVNLKPRHGENPARFRRNQ